MGLIFSDIPELEGTRTEIALTNLSSLETELAEAMERRIAHICELARAIIADGVDIDLIKSIILSVRSDGEPIHESVSDENIFELYSMFSGISTVERMMIFKEAFKMIPECQYSIPTVNNDLPFDLAGRISYVQNFNNDIAFEHLSVLVGDAKASYFESVTDVCESVVTGRSQFCILPIATAKDGKLLSFYDAILRFDLKICAEYDLDNIYGDGYTRYALLGRGVLDTARHKDIFLEMAYSDIDNIALKNLLTSAEFFGLECQSIDTIMLNNPPDRKLFCIEFKATDADIETFMTYLSVDCPDHLFIGLYQRI